MPVIPTETVKCYPSTSPSTQLKEEGPQGLQWGGGERDSAAMSPGVLKGCFSSLGVRPHLQDEPESTKGHPAEQEVTPCAFAKNMAPQWPKALQTCGTDITRHDGHRGTHPGPALAQFVYQSRFRVGNVLPSLINPSKHTWMSQ